MRLIADEWAHEAIQELRAATEWPHNAKFVCLPFFGTIAIGPTCIWHQQLLQALADDYRASGGSKLHFDVTDIVAGHIEWEDDGKHSIRTQLGVRPADDLLESIEAIAQRLLEAES